ncbi:MAG: 2'-5' RNA ligase family protein [Pirellulales bacterium]
MSNPDGVIIFAAIEPDAALHRLVQGYKDDTRALVGEQLYLADPPHLTIYLAVFPTVEVALDRWRMLTTLGLDLTIEVIGWHVFDADALTGNHTLVCDLAAADKVRLREVQQRVVERLAPARDVAATHARLAPRLHLLSEAQRAAVATQGFPYLGNGWEPHFTIASIRPDDWPQLWETLAKRPPRGSFRCPRMRLYQLVDGLPVSIDGLDDPP